MIIPFEDLKKYIFSVSNITIIHQKPSYRFLDINGRHYNGFLVFLNGECTYTFDNHSILLKPGSVIYLPTGSTHQLSTNSDNLEFYRIDFSLHVDSELALFSTCPLKMTEHITKECFEAVQELAEKYQYDNNSIAKTELLCKIFRTLHSEFRNPRVLKLAPAVQYLLQHLTETINCRTLASLCSLSTAQFYNLFHEEYHTTPLDYRNHLLMERARSLLRNGEFTVTEVSEMLGFESVSYFSRFFKKHEGISPMYFLKNM